MAKEYDVKNILDMRLIEGKKYFLIEWAGFARSAATWELEKDLSCNKLKKRFLKGFKRDPEFYKVQEILGHKYENGASYYYVRWVNYPGEDQWIPRGQLEKCENLIARYHNSQNRGA